jgi:hypothetical protein
MATGFFSTYSAGVKSDSFLLMSYQGAFYGVHEFPNHQAYTL